jgi:hypothetical protein
VTSSSSPLGAWWTDDFSPALNKRRIERYGTQLSDTFDIAVAYQSAAIEVALRQRGTNREASDVAMARSNQSTILCRRIARLAFAANRHYQGPHLATIVKPTNQPSPLDFGENLDTYVRTIEQAREKARAGSTATRPLVQTLSPFLAAESTAVLDRSWRSGWATDVQKAIGQTNPLAIKPTRGNRRKQVFGISSVAPVLDNGRQSIAPVTPDIPARGNLDELIVGALTDIPKRVSQLPQTRDASAVLGTLDSKGSVAAFPASLDVLDEVVVHQCELLFDLAELDLASKFASSYLALGRQGADARLEAMPELKRSNALRVGELVVRVCASLGTPISHTAPTGEWQRFYKSVREHGESWGMPEQLLDSLPKGPQSGWRPAPDLDTGLS